MNLADVLRGTAARHADRPAVTDVRSGRALTYGALARESERVSAFLARAGIEPGQRIGLVAPNATAYLPAAFGLLAAGGCLVPIASNLTRAESERIACDVELHGVLSWPEAAPLEGAHDEQTLADGECAGFRFAWLDRDAAGPPGFAATNPAFIRFTSGTTAESRGVVLSHEATSARVQASDRVLRFGEDDRVFWVLPLAYHFAVTIVAYVRAGAHVVLAPDSLPHAMLSAIRELAPTVLYASPLHFERLAAVGDGAKIEGVRVCLSTSAPISPLVIDRFESAYGVPVGQAYGIIEAGLPCINVRADGTPPTSVGRPVPGYGVRVFTDDGREAAPGASGEIGLRGDGLFSAYYAPWRRLPEIARDGWFMTGDIGRFDRSGALYLEGRTKAVIFVAGLKFFPEEVEECINRFPGIRESRVYGAPHAHLGQVPQAEIAAHGPLDLEDLRAHCATYLSPYKVPLEFTVVDAVARTPGGKLLRRATS